MTTFKVFLRIERDGIPFRTFTKRLEVDETQSGTYEQDDDADSGAFTALPSSQLFDIQLLMIQPNRQCTIRLDGQSDSGITLNGDGILLIVDAVIDSAPATNAVINNTSGAAALIDFIAGGT